MTVHTYLSFVAASLLFGLMPGPSVCYTIAHALRCGAWRTAPTIAGQAAANAVQIIVIVFGLSGALVQSAALVSVLRTVGAAYLVFIGIRAFRAAAPCLDKGTGPCRGGIFAGLVNGFIVCGTNPKALLYYAALLPQFISPHGDRNAQLLILGATSMLVGIVILSFYTLLAGRARWWLLERGFWRVQARVSGVLIVAAGAVLGLAGLDGKRT